MWDESMERVKRELEEKQGEVGEGRTSPVLCRYKTNRRKPFHFRGCLSSVDTLPFHATPLHINT